MARPLSALIPLALAVPPGQPPDSCPRGDLPAYAHNDYANARPLRDALALGYRGAEADVFLIDGVLRLGHDRGAARRGATFEATYLRPLAMLTTGCGALTADGRPFLLTVELKERAPAAYDTLAALAGRYAALLAPDSAHGRGPAVEVVLVGWRPTAPATGPSLGRQVRVRAPSAATTLAAGVAADSGVRLVSVDYGKTMGRWWVTGRGRRRWLASLRTIKAAMPDRLLRVHNVPVDARVYRELLGVGVDLIGTKALTASRRLLAGRASAVAP